MATDEENLDLVGQFPKTARPVFHSGLGDEEPMADGVYGKPVIVYRVPNTDDMTRASAIKKASGLGIKYEACFATARYFVFVVYE